VIRRKNVIKFAALFGRPGSVLRRNLAGSVQPFIGMLFDGLAKQAFAVTFAISPSGIKEIAPEVYRQIERRKRLSVIRPCPSAHSPHAVANFAYQPSCSTKRAVLHYKVQLLYEDVIIFRAGLKKLCGPMMEREPIGAKHAL